MPTEWIYICTQCGKRSDPGVPGPPPQGWLTVTDPTMEYICSWDCLGAFAAAQKKVAQGAGA